MIQIINQMFQVEDIQKQNKKSRIKVQINLQD